MELLPVGFCDTTFSFSSSNSYSLFNAAAVNSNIVQFTGGVFDGKYVYVTPNANGYVARLDAYPGPLSSALAISQSLGTFTVNYQLAFNVQTSGSATDGSSGINPSTSAGYLTVYINGSPQKIPYFN